MTRKYKEEVIDPQLYQNTPRSSDEWTKLRINRTLRINGISDEQYKMLNRNRLEHIHAIGLIRYEAKDRKYLYTLDIERLKTITQEEIDEIFPNLNSGEYWRARYTINTLGIENAEYTMDGIVVIKGDTVILPNGVTMDRNSDSIELLERLYLQEYDDVPIST